MATHAVNVVVKARDEASRKFGHIGKSANRMGSMFRSIALAAGVGLGIAGIIKGAKELIKVASEAEETASKFAAVFKEEAAAAEQFGNNLAKAVNRSRVEIREYLASLQDTFVPLGFARDQARQMSQTMTQLAVDMASFNNKADADVIRDLQSAIVGNHETVRKYGVIITQTSLNQELMNMGLEKGMKQATEQQKALARLNIVIKGTTDAQGDAIRTAGSFANQWKGLKANLKDGAATIGGFVLPQISKLITKIRTGFTIASVVVENWRLVLELAVKSFALGAINMAMTTKHWICVVIPDLLKWFARNWKDVFVTLWRGTQAIFTNMYKNIVNFFKAVWAWLKGEEFEFKWTSLLEGFESTLEELPKIAERHLTDIEKKLGARIAEIQGQLKLKIKERLELEVAAKEAVGKIELPEIKLENESKEILKKTLARQAALSIREARFLTFVPGARFDTYAQQTAKCAQEEVRLQKEENQLLKTIIRYLDKPKGIEQGLTVLGLTETAFA